MDILNIQLQAVMKSDLISVLMMAFLDLRVFNPNGKVYANIELSKAYGINKKKEKRKITNAFF